MLGANGVRGRSLEERSATLFLAAGVLLIGYAGLNGITAFTDATFEPNLFQLGYAVGFLGLLGLSPRFADERPWLARAGAVAATLGAVAISAFSVLDLAGLVGLPSADLQIRSVLVPVTLVGFVLGYLALGTASLRSGIYSRTVGLVLLIPGLVVVLMLVHIAVGLDSPGTAFVISAGQAMAHLAIGATLRAASEAEEHEEADAPADTTVKG